MTWEKLKITGKNYKIRRTNKRIIGSGLIVHNKLYTNIAVTFLNYDSTACSINKDLQDIFTGFEKHQLTHTILNIYKY